MTMTTKVNTLNASDSECGVQPISSCKKQLDDIFHLSPFVQLHENTIFPIAANIPPNLTTGRPLQYHNDSSSNGGCSDSKAFDGMDGISRNQDCQVS